MTRWLGDWELLPELSHYSAGGPPEAGRYIISAESGDIRFEIRWRAGEEDSVVTFAAPADGSDAASEFPGIDRFRVGANSDHILTSDALAGEVIVSHAVRRVSGDGTLMSVLQENGTGHSRTRIFQVYRRVSP